MYNVFGILERVIINKTFHKSSIIIISILFLLPIFFTQRNLINYEDFDNWPVLDYYNITSEYGERISPITGFKSYHSGIDIGAPEGSKLLAVVDSRVKFVGFIDGYGCTIILEKEMDDDIFFIFYSHISPNYIVREGMDVRKGDLIGYGGPKYINLDNKIILNGNTTGPHLHFEVRKDNININPIEFLNSIEQLEHYNV